MPDDQYEIKILALFERIARALEQIAINTVPLEQHEAPGPLPRAIKAE